MDDNTLLYIFYDIDNFCKFYNREIKMNLIENKKIKRNRAHKLEISEIVTISILFHFSGYYCFKKYYEGLVLKYWTLEFKNLVSYNRFLELRKKYLMVMYLYLNIKILKKDSKFNFIDSFCLKVSHEKRRSSHKVFKNMASKGKTSVEWIYGFKLHLITDLKGELVSFMVTPANYADNNADAIKQLTKNMSGKIYGDKGYLLNSELTDYLNQKNITFITKSRKNMKPKKISPDDSSILKKRGIIESIGKILKESMQLEHARHRSIEGFISHILSCLIAYSFKDSKPSFFSNLAIA